MDDLWMQGNLSMQARGFARMVRNQARNIARWARGEAIVVPPLGGMTLDADDVTIAQNSLGHRECWGSEGRTLEFESAFAEWNGSQAAFAFCDGRVALSACLHGLGVTDGDEVVVPGFTCVVVPNAVAFAGAVPIYADIELDTFGLDVRAFQDAIGPKTRAVILHHLFGLVCRDYLAILDVARRHRIYVVEDCAHAAGAEFARVKVGNRGDAGFYSCERSKSFSTTRGGLAVSRHPGVAERIHDFKMSLPLPDASETAALLNGVILDYYRYKHPRRYLYGDMVAARLGGYRRSITRAELDGAKPANYARRFAPGLVEVGLNQLRKLDSYNALRRKNANRWRQWCFEENYTVPLVLQNSSPVFIRFPVMVEAERKSDLRWARRDPGIEPGVWFLSNAHPAERTVPRCPTADRAVRQCINWPCIFGND